jgi:Na+-translocating ferredoxin:NAD+ oxidoreductase RnfG subunit
MITVLFTIALDGITALPSTATLLSLIPIAFGIGASSWNSPTFNYLGFIAAIISTTSQAALNVVSKRVMKHTGIHGIEAQRAMVFVALGIGLLMTIVSSIGQSIQQQQQQQQQQGGVGGVVVSPSTMTSTSTTTTSTDIDTRHHAHQKKEKEEVWSKKASKSNELVATQAETTTPTSQQHPPYWLTFVAVLAYHMEYVLSFSFVSMVEPITYGTCDALRRLLIIVAGKVMFGGAKFSNLNLGGMSMALVGALLFSITSARGGR